jgi:hypothetical protein
MPGMGSEGSSTPCDAGDDAMPEAPATFTGDLAAWYRFDRAAHYILVAQAAAKNGSEMVRSYLGFQSGYTDLPGVPSGLTLQRQGMLML